MLCSMLSALCGQLLSILSGPIIRNIFPMGWETVLLRPLVNIGLVWDVDDDRFLPADAFPSMIDPFGHLNQQRVMDSDEKFIDFVFGWRTFPRVIKNQFDHPLDGTDGIGLTLMIVPCLHHLGIGGGDIHLTEL